MELIFQLGGEANIILKFWIWC